MGSSPPSPLSPSFSFSPISPPLSGSLMLKGRVPFMGKEWPKFSFFFNFASFSFFWGGGYVAGDGAQQPPRPREEIATNLMEHGIEKRSFLH